MNDWAAIGQECLALKARLEWLAGVVLDEANVQARDEGALIVGRPATAAETVKAQLAGVAYRSRRRSRADRIEAIKRSAVPVSAVPVDFTPDQQEALKLAYARPPELREFLFG